VERSSGPSLRSRNTYSFVGEIMLRIVCCENDFSAAANVGGPSEVRYKTFDVECPEIEAWLGRIQEEKFRYVNRFISGVEVFQETSDGER